MRKYQLLYIISSAITEEQRELLTNSRNAFKDVRNYYYEALKELGYEPVDFDNNSFEIEKKYFLLAFFVVLLSKELCL